VSRPRKTVAQIREAARAERDIEVAAFLDGYAALVRAGRDDPCSGPLATSIEGLASSLRAGLVDEGPPSGLALVPVRSAGPSGPLNGTVRHAERGR